MVRILKLKAIMWAGFTLGGMVAAFVLPALIVITNLAVPFGIISADKLQYIRLAAEFSDPLTRLFVVVVLVATLYHAAYRLQTTLDEISMGKLGVASSIVAYGLLAVGASVLLYAVLMIT